MWDVKVWCHMWPSLSPFALRHRDQSHPEEPGRERGSANGAEAATASGCSGMFAAKHLWHSPILLHLLRELQEHDWRWTATQEALASKQQFTI